MCVCVNLFGFVVQFCFWARVAVAYFSCSTIYTKLARFLFSLINFHLKETTAVNNTGGDNTITKTNKSKKKKNEEKEIKRHSREREREFLFFAGG